MTSDNLILQKIISYAENDPRISAMVLFGSRAREEKKADRFSDYDLFSLSAMSITSSILMNGFAGSRNRGFLFSRIQRFRIMSGAYFLMTRWTWISYSIMSRM